MKILAPNRHTVYFLLFGKTGHEIDILTTLPGEELKWQTPLDELPKNMKLVEWSDDIKQKLDNGHYDLAVLLTLKDLIFFSKFKDLPIVFMVHIALYSHSLKLKLRWILKRFLLSVITLNRKITVAFSSPWKKSTWHYNPAPVIKHPPLPTPDIIFEEGTIPKAVTVGNHLDNREEVDFKLFVELRKHVEIDLIGQNPSVPDAITPSSRTEFGEELRKYQIFVFLLQFPWEDGYNLAVLEAMQSGMAVISMEHPTTLIEQGKNGFLCKSPEEMANRIKELQSNPDLARQFGERSKEIVAEKFSTTKFVDSWNELIVEAAAK